MLTLPVVAGAPGLSAGPSVSKILWSAEHKRTGHVVHVFAADWRGVSYWLHDDAARKPQKIDADDFLNRYQPRPFGQQGDTPPKALWSAVHRTTGKRIFIEAANAKRITFRFDGDKARTPYRLSIDAYEENYRPEAKDTPAQVIHEPAPVAVPPPIAVRRCRAKMFKECEAAETICAAVERAYGPAPGERPAIPVAASAQCAAIYLASTMFAIPIPQIAEAFRVEEVVADRIVRRMILLRSKSRRADVLLRRMERGLSRWVKDGRP